MKTKTTARLLSVLLCIMLVIGLVPITASAAPDYRFTIEPQGTILADGESFYDITWETNFTPVKLQITDHAGVAYATFSDPTSTTANLGMVKSHHIRAFYNSTDYIDSAPFSIIDRTKVRFDYQPESAIISDGNTTARVVWSTNFTPVKLNVLNENGVEYRGYTDPTINSDSFGEVNNNRIRAYYGSGSKDYIDSDPFTVIYPPCFTVQPYGGVVASASTSWTLRWETNFTPVAVQRVLADGTATTKYPDPTATSHSYYGLSEELTNSHLRAYYGTGDNDYVESDMFDVILADDAAFTTQPQGGVLAAGQSSIKVTWKTNFKPINLYDMNADGTYHGHFGNPEMTWDLFGPCEGRYLRAFYGEGDNDYVDSEPFSVTDNSPAFTVQPRSGQIPEGEKEYWINWKTNFTPDRLLLLDGTRLLIDFENTNTTACGLYAPGYDLKLRAYYGSGENDFIDSNTFVVRNANPPGFVYQPVGGEIPSYGNDLVVMWATNFTPILLQKIDSSGEVVETFNDPTVTCENYTPVENARIRAYYGRGENEYVDSEPFTVTKVLRPAFTVQPQDTEIPLGKIAATVSWETNFTPILLQRLDVSGEVVTTFNDPTLTSANFTEVYYARIRAYYGRGENKYVDSEPFTVTTAVSEPAFTVQPEGGDIPEGEDVLTVTWATNFTPVQLQLLHNGEFDVNYADPTTTSDTFLECENMQLRAFYGEGENDYIDSDPFTVEMYGIVKLKASLENDSIFFGQRAYINASAKGGTEPYSFAFYYMRVGTNKWNVIGTEFGTADNASFKPGVGDCFYQVKVIAKDKDGNLSAENIMHLHVSGDTQPAFTLQPQGGDIPEGEDVLTVTWATNFTPLQLQLLHNGEFDVNYADPTTTSDTFLECENMQLRAFYGKGENDYIDSDPFTVEMYGLVKIKMTIDNDTYYLGDRVNISASAKGGTEPYSYAFYYLRIGTSKWTVIGTEFGSASSTSFKPGVGDCYYQVKAIAKDKDGNTSLETIRSIHIASDRPLKNESSINSDRLTVGSKLTFTGAASGGTEPYKYTYSYKRTSAARWTVLGKAETDASTVYMTPSSTGTFDIRITVTDAEGATEDKDFTLTVLDGKSREFRNNSSVSASGIAPGTRFYMYGAAEGSDGYRYAYYYKRTSAKTWTVIGTEFGTQTSLFFTPRTEGEFNIKIDIMDEDGNIVSRQFAMTVNSRYAATSLVNESTISATTAVPGTPITIAGAASGGTGYKYAFYYKKAQAANWTIIGSEFGDAIFGRITLRNAGDYVFRSDVMDSDGHIASKGFTVEIAS